MIEEARVMVLSERDGIDNSHGCGAKIFSFELDVLGRPVSFRINVVRKQASLSDMIPLARALSTKLALAILDKFRESGKSVPCRKGCSACCSFLIPLSVPEVFRLRQEVLAMPPDQGKAVLQSCLETAEGILDRMPEDFDINELAQTNSEIQINRLSGWYTGLKLACPFLLDSLCTLYEQRPIACREHIVTGSAASCDLEKADELHIVQIPISVLECLGQLAAELEQSDIEAVMLPLALPWAQENLDRSRRTWPAVTIVERFIEILEAKSRNIPTPTQARV